MVLSLEELFGEKQRRDTCEEVDVTCSYLEVYNEVRRASRGEMYGRRLAWRCR